MGVWDELHRAVYIPPGRRLTPVGDAELDAFEARFGLKLPASFREFAETFGTYELGSRALKIYMPALDGPGGEPRGLAYIQNDMQELARADAAAVRSGHYTMENGEVGVRLVYFAFDMSDDAFGWDPSEVTDAETNEYAIWVRGSGYEPVASSLVDLIMGDLLRSDLERWRDAGSPAGEEFLKFEPGEDPRIFLEPQ
jgi:hypothetical protein